MCWLVKRSGSRWRFSFPCGSSSFRILSYGTHKSSQSYVGVHPGILPKDRPLCSLSCSSIYNVFSVYLLGLLHLWLEGYISCCTSKSLEVWTPLLPTVPGEPHFFPQLLGNPHLFPQFLGAPFLPTVPGEPHLFPQFQGSPVSSHNSRGTPLVWCVFWVAPSFLHFRLPGVFSFMTHFQPPCFLLQSFLWQLSKNLCQIMVRIHQ